MLTVKDHSRDVAGYKYVYPVISRRAGGLSLGINLNVNNACNWRCIYCQVPNLTRGAAPAVQLPEIKAELCSFLEKIIRGDYLNEKLPSGLQRFNDIAFSGNGEPTSAPNFLEVIDCVASVRRSSLVPDSVKTVLITNGSLVHQDKVLNGLEKMRRINGEVWFKIDRATQAGIEVINDVKLSPERIKRNLTLSANACPTWIQTCMFKLDKKYPSEDEVDRYLAFIDSIVADDIPIKGVLLYGIAR